MDKYIFDSHAHYDDEKFSADRDALLSSLPEKGVAGVIAAACTLESAVSCAGLAARYDYIWCGAGIHPHDAKNAPADMEESLSALAAYEKCVAIGEAGLDYHYDFSPREKQTEVFERQLALAGDLNLPVIIHEREAETDILALIKKYRPKGVVHCFLGSAEMAAEIVRFGLYVGFTGAVTFKSARHTLEAAAAIPKNRLLIETDCPYMAPVPLRGKRCDSSMLVYTASALAEAIKIETGELFKITYENALELFDIKA